METSPPSCAHVDPLTWSAELNMHNCRTVSPIYSGDILQFKILKDSDPHCRSSLYNRHPKIVDCILAMGASRTEIYIKHLAGPIHPGVQLSSLFSFTSVHLFALLRYLKSVAEKLLLFSAWL